MTNLVYGIHGKLKNNRRARIIKNFTDSKNGCLISTDVTSRGIDFDRIHYIIQIDPPEDPDNYIHRIGRTARINRPGVAILMIDESWQLLNQKCQKVGQQTKNSFQFGGCVSHNGNYLTGIKATNRAGKTIPTLDKK